MRLWIVLGVLVAALGVCDATFFLTKHLFKQDAPETPKERPHGVWRKKMVWKPRWVKEWKEAKIWKPVWKKVWDPVWIQEWVTIPKPHPKKNGANGVDLTSSQPSPGDFAGPDAQPGPVYGAPDSGDTYNYPDQGTNAYLHPDFSHGNGGNGGYLPPDPNPPAPAPGNVYGPPGPTPGNGYGPPEPGPGNSYGPPAPSPGNSYGPPDFSKPQQGSVYLAPDYSAPTAPSQGQFGPGGSYLPPGNPPSPPGPAYGPPAGSSQPGNAYLPPPDGHNRKSDSPKEDEFRPSQPLPDLSGFQPIVAAILKSA